MEKIEIETEQGTLNISENEVNRTLLLDEIGAAANAEKDEEKRSELDRLAGWLARVRFAE